MFVFLLALRNRSTVDDWERCCGLCRQTLKSMLEQKGVAPEQVRVVLVCREHDPAFEDPRVDVISEPFPDPGPTGSARSEDKWNKYERGLVHIREHYAPCYVMRFDADDLTSDRIAAHVLGDDNRHGYYVTDGYRWRSGSAWVEKWPEFHIRNGSSNVFFATPEQLPSAMGHVPEVCDLRQLGHHIAVRKMAERGAPLAPVPFPSVIALKDTGQNLGIDLEQEQPVFKPNWKFYVGQPYRVLKRWLKSQPLTPELREEFSIQEADAYS